MAKKYYTTLIGGAKWNVKLQKPPEHGAVGLCDYDKKTLYVTPGAQQDTILRHEVLHARLPDFDEAAILSIEQALYDANKGLQFIGQP
jgi:hypothetical protein